MRAFACPVCNNFTAFEAARCRNCHADVGLHPPTNTMLAVLDGAASVDGQRWIRCTQSQTLGCNWLVPDEQEAYRRGRCLADSLIRREPDAADTIAREKLVPTAAALRRLVHQLLDLGLPVDPFWSRDGGLAFDLLSSYSEGKKVIIGHANGVITIDLVESLDAYRESLRVRLGEPYRTMLGHFRHEVGHYYQNVLVETGSGAEKYLADCRDAVRRRTHQLRRRDRAPLQVRRTRRLGADIHLGVRDHASLGGLRGVLRALPAHHRQHRHRREAGMVLRADRVRFSVPRDIEPLESYADVPIERMLYDWHGCRCCSIASTPRWARLRCTRSRSPPLSSPSSRSFIG